MKTSLDDHYRLLPDDELACLTIQQEQDLLPEAKEALAAELRRRGLSDLSQYRQAMAEAAAIAAPEQQRQIAAERSDRRSEWSLVILSWVAAPFLPFMLASNPRDWPVWVLCILLIANIVYLGRKARQENSGRALFLKFKLPLILLGISAFLWLVTI